MNLWEKKISLDPHQDIVNIVQFYSKEEKLNIISGLNPSYTNTWTPLQCILFWNPLQYKKIIFQLLEEGANPNVYSKKGLNFYHLFLTLFFFHKDFQNKEIFDIYMETLKYGFDPNSLIILTARQIYLFVDYFQNLLLHKIEKTTFLQNVFISSFEFQHAITKDPDFYEPLFLSLFCNQTYLKNNFKFKKKNPHPAINFFHDLTCCTISDIPFYLKHDIFRQYLIRHYKLPSTLSNNEMLKRIWFLHKHRDLMETILKDVDPIYPVDRKPSLREELFFNPDLVDNKYLHFGEFLSPLLEFDKNYYFHHNYFPLLLQKKINPYSRQEISLHTLSTWKQELQSTYTFPIQYFFEKPKNYSFFHLDEMSHYEKRQKAFTILEQFFQFYHPYNQIRKIVHLKPFEIKYFAHVLYKDSVLLIRFKKVFEKPNIDVLFKQLLYYCRKGPKFVNMLFFFSEEIFQDLQCYENIKDYVQNLDENSEQLWNQYFSRYNSFHPIMMKKFLEQLMIIENYKNSFVE
jgi:hypothetical protein